MSENAARALLIARKTVISRMRNAHLVHSVLLMANGASLTEASITASYDDTPLVEVCQH